ncbi:retrovirus-related pol polyprotein from transposon TNT 1-94 [Tanacetum coccineum]
MAQENYIEGCSMKRPPLLDPNGFYFWKARFETYVKSKYIDLWQVIQNNNFYFEVEDEETKLMKETPYELLKDNEKRQLGKNEEAKMIIYNVLPRKEYERVFMSKTSKEVWHTLIITHQGNSQVKNCKIDLLTQEYEKFLISNEETIDSAKVMAIEEAKDLDTLPLDDLIGNLKLKLLGNKLVMIDGSDEDVDEEEADAFNLLARNFCKFFHKGNWFRRGHRFGNTNNRFGKGHSNSFKDKGGESSKKKGACYNCGIDGHFASECRKLKENNAFMRGAWSDSEDGDEHQNDATCLMAINSQEVCLICDLLSDDSIVDSGCTKHMTENRRLFTLYKAYDDRHVVFRSNLKGKVVGGGIMPTKIEITLEQSQQGVSNDVLVTIEGVEE